jgi:hypothetical protein
MTKINIPKKVEQKGVGGAKTVFTFPLDDYPHIPESAFIYLPVTKDNLGRSHGDRFYNKNADYVFVTLRDGIGGVKESLKTVPASKMICDFYFWDDRLTKFKDANEYHALIHQLKMLGITKLVGTDFSVYKGIPKPLGIYNHYLNLNRIFINNQEGMKTVLNSSVVRIEEYMEISEYSLPKNIPTVMFDEGHTFYYEEEKQHMKTIAGFLERHMVKSAIIHTGSPSLKNRIELLKMLKDHGIAYGAVPTKMALMNRVKASQENKKKIKTEVNVK